MKAIKFASSDPKQKQFAVAVRKNVNDYFRSRNLSTKGNTAVVVQTLGLLAIYVVPFILVLTLPMNGWLALGMVVLMGIGVAGVGMCVMHDAVHGSYSRRPWLNKLMSGTMYLLGGDVFNWKIQHNVLHHAYTNVEGYDQDIASKGPIRLSEHAPLRKIHKYQFIHAFFFYGLMTISKLVKDFSQLIQFTKAGLTKQHHVNPVLEYLKMILIKLTYISVFIGLPLLVTHFTWWQVLTGFFIMHLTAGCILSTVFQMAHVVEGTTQTLPNADGIIETEWMVHELATTSDFARHNLFLNWYVGGLNFQIEHHLFPNICHIHYRKIAPIVERTAKEFGFTYNLKPSFASALSSQATLASKDLPRQKFCRPGKSMVAIVWFLKSEMAF